MTKLKYCHKCKQTTFHAVRYVTKEINGRKVNVQQLTCTFCINPKMA